jgi:hypothetical protein
MFIHSRINWNILSMENGDIFRKTFWLHSNSILMSWRKWNTCAFCLKVVYRVGLGRADHLWLQLVLQRKDRELRPVPCSSLTPRKLKDIITINGWTEEGRQEVTAIFISHNSMHKQTFSEQGFKRKNTHETVHIHWFSFSNNLAMPHKESVYLPVKTNNFYFPSRRYKSWWIKYKLHIYFRRPVSHSVLSNIFPKMVQ